MNAIVTYASTSYLPGAGALIAGIRRHDTTTPIYLITDAAEGPCRCIYVQPDVRINDDDAWPRQPFSYTQALDWDAFDRVIVIQPDVLVVGDIRRITEAPLPAFGAVPDYGKVTPNDGDWGRYNDGVFIFTPRHGLSDDFPAGCFGQPSLNRFAETHAVCELPYTWNLSRRWFRHRPDAWNAMRAEIVAVHFTGPVKPWMGDDPEYQPLFDAWREHARGNFIELPEA